MLYWLIVAMEKSPSSVHHNLDACRALLCSKAGSKNNFHPCKRKITEKKLQRSHRHQHVEKMWWWDRADQQVSCVIFSEIIHSLDDYSSINVKTEPAVKQTTWQGATVSYPSSSSSLSFLSVSDCLCQNWLTSFSSTARAKPWNWPHMAHSYPSHVKK